MRALDEIRRLAGLLLASGCLATGSAVALAGDIELCGEPTAGPCDEPHAGIGCNWNACCQIVCEFDFYCCQFAWDPWCVELYEAFCLDLACGQPGAGLCSTSNDLPGCQDEECCFFICRIDGWCCSVRWDQWCADEAIQLCDVPPCELVVPDDVREEAELCGERLNDGCNLSSLLFDSVTCGETILGSVSTGAPRDSDWYEIQIDEPTTLHATLAPEFPGEVMIVQGPCDATRVLDVRNSSACAPTTLSIELDPGTWWVVVSIATDARAVYGGMPCEDPKDPMAPTSVFNRRYLLSVDCAAGPDPIFGDLNGDGIVDGADLGILLQSWGTCVGCPADFNGDGVVDGADLGILLQSWSV